MSLRSLPEVKSYSRLGVSFDLRPDALERWEPAVRALSSGGHEIEIYDFIGEDMWGEGVTAKRIASELKALGKNDVTVNINSPGGDFFEGVAIYNLLREHPAKVSVRVMGLAASAASVIAMAGDEIAMGDGSFLMIHNAWAIAIGNRHDMREAADRLEPFDGAMADVYASRSGQDRKHIAAMMDKETWLGASKAVDDGFADRVIERAEPDPDAKGNKKALAIVEAAMAKAGHSRSQRRDALQALFSGSAKPCAAEPAKPCAGDYAADLSRMLEAITANT